MAWLLAPICWVFGHRRCALTINGNFSGRETCERCGAKWWRGGRDHG